jgi:aspartyl-tRNA(Asn)/glutamyl-tRNA(Gln) amidotransferase subunit A
LKTSAGLLPTSGVLPLSEILDTIGPMARTVADVAVLFDVLTGAMRFNVADIQKWGGSFVNWRIGVPTDLGVDLHPETAAVFEQAIAQLRKAGATLVPVTLSSSIADYAAPCGMYLAVDGYRHYGHFADAEPSLIGHGVRERILSGKSISAATYLTQQENRAREIQTIESLFEKVDALFFPTTPMPAPILGQHPEFESPAVFTRFANYFNLAAISLPAGITSLGLPVGMQFVVPRLREDRAIELAQRFETVNGGPLLCPLIEAK